MKDELPENTQSRTVEGLSDKNKLLYGEFKPDERYLMLENRLALYYRQTPDEMSNADAAFHWRNFIKWCKDYGFSRDEINRAKISPRFKRV